MRQNILLVFILGSLVFFSSCTKTEAIPKKEHSVLSVLWQQNAAEYKALCYQAFNVAKQRIQNMKAEDKKTFAIITDIDETVLDNSPYNAMMIKKDVGYNKQDWVNWGKHAQAKALPGAVEFFNYANSLGIEIFYISNRYNVQLEETIENLRKLNFPQADTNHVYLKTNTSHKQIRRDKVLENYSVILYMGDNLSDFSALFDDKNSQERNAIVDRLKNSFGKEFIVFPNPMYGDWETKGIYENKRPLTEKEKISIRQSKLITY